MTRHMQVIIDGETKYDGEIHEWHLPSMPERLPEAMGLDPNKTGPPTPMARLFGLTVLVKFMMSGLKLPMLQPLKVDMQLRGPGCFTLTVDTPVPMNEIEA